MRTKIRTILFTMILVTPFMSCQTIPGKEGGLSRSKEILAYDMNFNPKTGDVSYVLPEPALARIRIGIKDGGPLLHTLIDWEQRPSGLNVEHWNLKDNTQKVDFSHFAKDLILALSFLPVDTRQRAEYTGRVRGQGKSPDFTLSLPEARIDPETDFPVVAGNTPFKIALSDKDKTRFTDSKYELGIFIDQVFYTEDEEATSPFTYILRTEGFSPGQHTITVNVSSYTGEIGARSLNFLVRNNEMVNQ